MKTKFILSLVLIILLSACSEIRSISAPSSYQLTYEAPGTTYGVVTLINDQGGTETHSFEYGQGYKQTYTMHAGDVVELSVQDQIGHGMKVTCNIYIDGVLWKTTTSDAGLAACRGTVGKD